MVGRKRKIDVFSDFSTGRSRTENDDWGDLLSKRIKRLNFEAVQHNEGVQGGEHKPSLLGIPGELRNNIYRLVLLESHDITVDAQDCLQPAILWACRQTRSEASTIFEEENSFILVVNNFKFGPQRKHWFWNKGFVMLVNTGTASWSNFKVWLRFHWAGSAENEEKMKKAETATKAAQNVLGEDEFIFKQAFDLVATLRTAPWDTVEKALEVLRKTVDGKKTAWAFSD